MRRYYGPTYTVRAYSSVTHKHYRLRASGSYRTGELGIWKLGRGGHLSIGIAVYL